MQENLLGDLGWHNMRFAHTQACHTEYIGLVVSFMEFQTWLLKIIAALKLGSLTNNIMFDLVLCLKLALRITVAVSL